MFKVQGSLHRKGLREVTWSVVRGGGTMLYHLSPTQTEAVLFPSRG
jgi:hypothetical protein